MAALLAFIVKLEGRDLGSIALRRPSGKDIQWAILFWAISTVLSGGLHQLLPPPAPRGMDSVLELSLPVIVALILTTAITEEIPFLGYSIERFKELTGRLYVWRGNLWACMMMHLLGNALLLIPALGLAD